MLQTIKYYSKHPKYPKKWILALGKTNIFLKISISPTIGYAFGFMIDCQSRTKRLNIEGHDHSNGYLVDRMSHWLIIELVKEMIKLGFLLNSNPKQSIPTFANSRHR